MKLLVMQYSPASCHFFLLGPIILFSTLFSNTLHIFVSFSVRDRVPHPYKKAVKYIDTYFGIFRWQAKRNHSRFGRMGLHCSTCIT
jgi:hypothetical protein